MCFWNVSKYRIYENQPATMLGRLSSPAYKTLCPNYHVTQYELLNGTKNNLFCYTVKSFTSKLTLITRRKTVNRNFYVILIPRL